MLPSYLFRCFYESFGSFIKETDSVAAQKSRLLSFTGINGVFPIYMWVGAETMLAVRICKGTARYELGSRLFFAIRTGATQS